MFLIKIGYNECQLFKVQYIFALVVRFSIWFFMIFYEDTTTITHFPVAEHAFHSCYQIYSLPNRMFPRVVPPSLESSLI